MRIWTDGRMPGLCSSCAGVLVRRALVIAVVLSGTSCAAFSELGAGKPRWPAPTVDEATLGLWHLDEEGGDMAADAGPLRLDGLVGDGAASAPGYVGMARRFSGDPEAFLVSLRSWSHQGLDSLTVEAYVRLAETTKGGLETIAAQWTGTEATSSWYFGVADTSGQGGLFRTANASPRTLVFAYVRGQRRAGRAAVEVALSEKQILPGVWTHVAVTFDRGRIRFYRDHAPDLDSVEEVSQDIADGTQLPNCIQGADTPVTIGTFLRDVMITRSGNVVSFVYPGVTFEGELDEVRVSQGVRSDIVLPSPTR